MDRLAGILFQVNALNANGNRFAIIAINVQRALAHDGVGELADLIALWQIGIEIILPIKPAPQIDLSPKAKARPHRLFNAIAVQDRQHAGHARIHKADVGVWCAAIRGAGTGK